ncbi:MAG: hypothetical protein H5T60_05765 [Anaerolineae bacterium]|nr:hypothetical protein [Anaerolineae bacterium]
MSQPTKTRGTVARRPGLIMALAVGAFLLGALGVLLWRVLGAPAGAEMPIAGGGTAAGNLVARPPTQSPTAAPLTLGIAHTNDTWGYLFPCG